MSHGNIIHGWHIKHAHLRDVRCQVFWMTLKCDWSHEPLYVIPVLIAFGMLCIHIYDFTDVKSMPFYGMSMYPLQFT